MARWVRALAAQARVAEVRCQSPSSKQGPAHWAATEWKQEGDWPSRTASSREHASSGFSKEVLPQRNKAKSEKKIPTPLASMCSLCCVHTHHSSNKSLDGDILYGWTKFFPEGTRLFTWKSQFRVPRELLAEDTPVAHKQYALLPLLTVVSRTVRPCCWRLHILSLQDKEKLKCTKLACFQNVRRCYAGNWKRVVFNSPNQLRPRMLRCSSTADIYLVVQRHADMTITGVSGCF